MHPILEYLAGFIRELWGDAAVKSIGAVTGGVFLGWVGGSWVPAKALLVLMCIDFLLGFYRAWLGRCISSRKLRHGFTKFIFYLVGIIAAYHVDEALDAKFAPLITYHVDFVGVLILYLVLCDALSVFRHLHCLGMPIPHQLINRLESLRDCKLTKNDPKGGEK